ncbi:hypothetical protein Tco_0823176 [Tanacetum coccineum]|uniref:Uncharacterized protein n=1 Tax=Tanacetum coccineum TaxID=301880 RepID=A0ABQ5AKH1_9ASTR
MSDSIGGLVSLGDEIFSEGKESWELNIGGGTIAGRAIITWGGGITSLISELEGTIVEFGEEEVWEVNEDWLMAPTTPPPVLAVPPPSVYEVGGPSTAVSEGLSFLKVAPGLTVPPCMIEDLSTRLDNLEYGHGQLVQRVIQGSDAEIAACVIIGEIGSRVLGVVEKIQTSTQKDETVTGLTQQVQALQADVQQRDTQIQQLHTTITEMNSKESTLMRCILGLEKRIAALERIPLGPQ